MTPERDALAQVVATALRSLYFNPSKGSYLVDAEVVIAALGHPPIEVDSVERCCASCAVAITTDVYPLCEQCVTRRPIPIISGDEPEPSGECKWCAMGYEILTLDENGTKVTLTLPAPLLAGETDAAPVPTDRFRLCIKSTHDQGPVDVLVNLDERDVVDTASVLLGALSSDANNAAAQDEGADR